MSTTIDTTSGTIPGFGKVPSAPKGSPAASKPKKAVKKVTKTKAKPSANGRGPTVRERVFKLISQKPMTGSAIATKLELAGIPSFLKDEVFGTKPRIKREVEEGVRGVLYSLTAAGKADLASGKVNENAAAPTGGKDIPSNR